MGGWPRALVGVLIGATLGAGSARPASLRASFDPSPDSSADTYLVFSCQGDSTVCTQNSYVSTPDTWTRVDSQPAAVVCASTPCAQTFFVVDPAAGQTEALTITLVAESQAAVPAPLLSGPSNVISVTLSGAPTPTSPSSTTSTTRAPTTPTSTLSTTSTTRVPTTTTTTTTTTTLSALPPPVFLTAVPSGQVTNGFAIYNITYQQPTGCAQVSHWETWTSPNPPGDVTAAVQSDVLWPAGGCSPTNIPDFTGVPTGPQRVWIRAIGMDGSASAFSNSLDVGATSSSTTTTSTSSTTSTTRAKRGRHGPPRALRPRTTSVTPPTTLPSGMVCGYPYRSGGGLSVGWDTYTGILCVTGDDPAGYAVVDGHVYAGQPGDPPNFKLALYEGNGASGNARQPVGTPVCESDLVTLVPGDNVIPLAGCPVLAPRTSYFILFVAASPDTQIGDLRRRACRRSGSKRTGRHTSAGDSISDPFPNAAAVEWLNDFCQETLWLDLVPAGN